MTKKRYAFLTEPGIKRFLVIFYAVGITGLMVPSSFAFFVVLIPWTLLLNVILLSLFHKDGYDIRSIAVFLFICLSSFVIEVAGVKTGLVFGNYAYGNSLGIKLLNTPVIIGLNWLLLTYTTSSVLETLRMPLTVKIAASSFLMVIYDFALEKVAPRLDMWSWINDSAPLRNYIMWFLMAAMYHALIKVSGVKTDNPLSAVILVSQFVFLTVLSIFLR